MTQPLEALEGVLLENGELARFGEQRFNADRLVRYAVERLWIYAGNLADQHRREQGLDLGVEPWAELVATRNVYAHYTPGQLSSPRVWHDTLNDLGRILQQVRAARS